MLFPVDDQWYSMSTAIPERQTLKVEDQRGEIYNNLISTRGTAG